MEDEVIERFWNDVAPVARKGGYDAFYLVLHGAMAAQSLPDVEGEILRRYRSIKARGNSVLLTRSPIRLLMRC
jgi:microcystin degradation protein MlrC